MIPPEVLIPAAVSLIIGVIAHFVSLIVSRAANKNKLDIRGLDSLETQLETKVQEIYGLRQSNLDLRDLKHQLELKIESLKREKDELHDEIDELRGENVNYREQIFELRQEVSRLQQKKE